MVLNDERDGRCRVSPGVFASDMRPANAPREIGPKVYIYVAYMGQGQGERRDIALRELRHSGAHCCSQAREQLLDLVDVSEK